MMHFGGLIMLCDVMAAAIEVFSYMDVPHFILCKAVAEHDGY